MNMVVMELVRVAKSLVGGGTYFAVHVPKSVYKRSPDFDVASLEDEISAVVRRRGGEIRSSDIGGSIMEFTYLLPDGVDYRMVFSEIRRLPEWREAARVGAGMGLM